MSVLTCARDVIHAGWKLLHHPLYGNYRPYQQPYRSLLLAHEEKASVSGADGIGRVVSDAMSLHLIEEALVVYHEAPRVLTPEEAPASLRDACALLDFELMRLPLEQAGLPDHLLVRSA